jgi:hypothetical protein
MKITQLSVFAENKPGYIIAPCRLLAGAGVEIRAISLAETQRFGVLRLIVSDWQKSAKLLEEAGYMVKPTEVLAVEVPGGPSGLAEVLGVVENSSLNIEYMYAFPFDHGDKAILVFRFDDLDAAIEQLQSAGISMLAREELQGSQVVEK